MPASLPWAPPAWRHPPDEPCRLTAPPTPSRSPTACRPAGQPVLLFGLGTAAGGRGGVAAHGGGDVHQPALRRQRLAPFGHALGGVAQEPRRIGLAEQRRRLAHRDSTWAEGFDRKP